MFNDPEIDSQRQRLLKALMAAGGEGLTSSQIGQYCGRPTNRIHELREDYLIDGRHVQGNRWVYVLIRKKTIGEKMAEIEADLDKEKRLIAAAVPLRNPKEFDRKLCELRVGQGGRIVLLCRSKGVAFSLEGPNGA